MTNGTVAAQPLDLHAVRAAFYGFSRGAGGIGRVMINLMNGLSAEGLQVDLLLQPGGSPDLVDLDSRVRVVDLKGDGTATRVAGLKRYLGAERPAVLLTNKE